MNFFSRIYSMIHGRRSKAERKKITDAYRYHHDLWQVIVTEEELLYQLSESSNQDNLIRLLMYGKALPDYEIRLMRAALKFELIGSMFYPVDEEYTAKPPAKVYVRELFQGYYETIDEVKDAMQHISKEEVSMEEAKRVFRKMVFVMNTCCLLMAETFEPWWENIYRLLIEWVIQHDDYSFPDKDNIWSLFPKHIPKGTIIYSEILSRMPKEFGDKLAKSYYEDIDNIRH